MSPILLISFLSSHKFYKYFSFLPDLPDRKTICIMEGVMKNVSQRAKAPSAAALR